VAHEYAAANVPVIAIGVGTDYNEGLLAEISSITSGRPYHLRDMADLAAILDQEIGVSAKEVLTDLRASIELVKGVKLDSISRVYPALAEVDITSAPYRLGNIQAGDYSVYVVELTLQGISRPPSRARIAQVGVTSQAPALGRWEESAPQNVFLEFTPDAAAVARVEEEVVGYVQQKNLDVMVRQAIEESTVDQRKASQTLRVAIGMTQRLGNGGATRLLENALHELDSGGSISLETRKTVALGMKTKTVKTGAADNAGALPDDERIRQMTGS
jgi:Ca-activated chloride channel family protein